MWRSGCLILGVAVWTMAAMGKTPDITDAMSKRAKDFRATVGAANEVGVYIYSQTLSRYEDAPAELVARCATLGVTDVYLAFSVSAFAKTADYGNWTRKLIRRFHDADQRVFAVCADNWSLYYDTNAAVSKIISAYLSFNAAGDPTERFDGLSADLEPHCLKPNVAGLPANFTLRWRASGFGRSGPNSQLMALTLNVLKALRKKVPDILFSEAVVPLYHQAAVKGTLASGKIEDFLVPCSYVSMMAYQAGARQVMNECRSALKDTRAAKTILLTVKIRVDDDDDGLDVDNWNDVVKELKALIKDASAYPSFRGVCFYEYERLEQLWEDNKP